MSRKENLSIKMMELKKLSDIQKNKEFNFQKLDYLYLHEYDDYPNKAEMNFENFYFVVNVHSDSLNLHCLINSNQRTIAINQLTGNWWILRVPAGTLKKLK